MSSRILTTIVLLIAVQFGFLAVHRRGNVVELTHLPSELPLVLGSWQGEPQELPPRLFEATGADVAESRLYRDAEGRTISMHVSVFRDYYRRLQHHPRVCYNAAGYRQVDEEKSTMQTPSGTKIRVSVTTWQEGDYRVQTLHWFQLGDQIMLEEEELRPACWNIRNQKDWPLLVKVLLQTPADPGSAEALKDLAARIHDSLDNTLCVPKAVLSP